MAETVEFELVSPAKLLMSEQVEMVVMPGTEGNFASQPRHAPMISTLRPGVIEVYADNKVTERIFVAGGFAEINEERCTVLAEEAMPVEQIDAAGVEARLKAAQQALDDAETPDQAKAAETAMAVAQAMQAAIGGAKAAH
ncbi:MAG: F0F1 ATP synthase subunit epsilon [Rhodospirillales bacterium]|nr:F0F1 ATP synthase subunit epsilon [Rhodospirillales bacterium]